MKLDTVCPAVWDHLCVNTMGKNRLCCNAVTQDKDKFIGNLDQHWNALRDGVKKEMLAGNRPDICKSCWKKKNLEYLVYEINLLKIIRIKVSGINL